MEKEHQLLRSIHKNAEMGKTSIPQVLEVTKDPSLQSALRHQLAEYTDIAGKAADLLRRKGLEAEDLGPIQDFVSGMMVRAKTMTDRRNTHIAEMMIQGSTMGTIQMARQIHSCEAADGESMELANRLMRLEERNIEQMKHFL